MIGRILLGALLAASIPTTAFAHGYEMHGSSPFRFGISMYIARPMRVGVTQPVFECWCRRMLAGKPDLIVFSRDELNPPDDTAWQATKAKLEAVDLFVVTENPELEFAEALLEKADMMYQRPLIYVDLGIPALESKYEDPYAGRRPPMPWFSTIVAPQLMYAIANACMRMDPANNIEYRKGWQDYNTLLEGTKRRLVERSMPWQNIPVRAISLRGGEEYLMEEAGMTIAGAVPPLTPGPLQLDSVAATAEALRKARASVLVTTEPLDDGVRAAMEKEAGVLVCELEPVNVACNDPYEFDQVMERNIAKLLSARSAVWQWAVAGEGSE